MFIDSLNKVQVGNSNSRQELHMNLMKINQKMHCACMQRTNLL